ncbi:MAG: hypothetical protein JG774_1816 [Desulfomicrobiaceae bacterium]|nr:hypothetical protein [Desulfomicrobiaceae bacterium]
MSPCLFPGFFPRRAQHSPTGAPSEALQRLSKERHFRGTRLGPIEADVDPYGSPWPAIHFRGTRLGPIEARWSQVRGKRETSISEAHASAPLKLLPWPRSPPSPSPISEAHASAPLKPAYVIRCLVFVRAISEAHASAPLKQRAGQYDDQRFRPFPRHTPRPPHASAPLKLRIRSCETKPLHTPFPRHTPRPH